MSVTAALQKLIVARLKADAAVAAIVGARVYDRPPANPTFPFVSLGPSSSLRVPGDCKALRDETFQVDAWSSDQRGMIEARRLCEAIANALHEFDAEPDAGALIDLRVVDVRVFGDLDPLVTHGVVTVTAQVEG